MDLIIRFEKIAFPIKVFVTYPRHIKTYMFFFSVLFRNRQIRCNVVQIEVKDLVSIPNRKVVISPSILNKKQVFSCLKTFFALFEKFFELRRFVNKRCVNQVMTSLVPQSYIFNNITNSNTSANGSNCRKYYRREKDRDNNSERAFFKIMNKVARGKTYFS